ncbi:MAG TPA: TRAP transporter substrate-binding protein DctP [Desulfobacteraceae bacterium]|nr:TRAP transporter substrate-binding protein DctP [Deltaproteobacteria bacterium]HDI59494.1 TRAP transporter substrate-binding protein DctP [Desulfobacteraceae bacterium]
MKKGLKAAAIFTAMIFLVTGMALAQDKKTKSDRQKFGADPRIEQVKHLKVKTSDKKHRWKMVLPWTKGLLFYDMAVHFCDTVRLASGGRLDIKAYSAGELVPAMEIFDAVSKGSFDAGHDWPGYWKGKNEAFIAFGSVPYGLDAELYNIWLYERGGLEEMQKLYGQYNLFALPGGQAGQEMGLNSNRRASKMEDFKGMKVRTWGWYLDILNELGASGVATPGGEIYLSLQTGVLDAAEFSSPAVNYPMGFDEVTKYIIQPGVHQPACQFAFFFNKQSYDALGDDLKWILDTAAKETQLWSYSWLNNLNAEAIRRFQKTSEIVMMDESAIVDFAKTTQAYLEKVKERCPDCKRLLESQEALKIDFADWRSARAGVTPWPLDEVVKGKLHE